VARAPDAVVGPAFPVAEPARQPHHTGRRAHGLCVPVEAPQRREEQRGHAEPQSKVGEGGDKQADRHELADVAAVRQKTVQAFADRVGEEQCRPDVPQLLGGEIPRIHKRFLHHVQAQPADVVEPVNRHHHKHRLLAAPAVIARLRLLRASHRPVRRRFKKRHHPHSVATPPNCALAVYHGALTRDAKSGANR